MPDSTLTTEERRHDLRWAGVPPSVNHYWGTRVIGKHVSRYITNEGRAFKEEFMALIPLGHQLTGPLDVNIVLYFSDKRRRDVDNYMKAVLDACQPRAFKDDAQIVRLTIVKLYRRDHPGIELHVTEMDEHTLRQLE